MFRAKRRFGADRQQSFTLLSAQPPSVEEQERAEAHDGGAVELRGILMTLSNRFYTGGWGYGQLQTERHEIVKITGNLEGHVVGTSLIVRGEYKDGKFGRELACSSIMVDSVSGELNVVHAWARKHCKKYEKTVLMVMRGVPAEERWEALVDVKRLMRAPMSEDDALAIANAAVTYLASIQTKRALMEKGFTDAEADRLYGRYKEKAVSVIDEDPYRSVLERVLPFGRVDAVVSARFARNDPQRLRAAQVQALVGLLRDGHTCASRFSMQQLAADIAGLYPEEIIRVGVPRAIVEFEDGDVQLKKLARQETAIARWVARALEREE